MNVIWQNYDRELSRHPQWDGHPKPRSEIGALLASRRSLSLDLEGRPNLLILVQNPRGPLIAPRPNINRKRQRLQNNIRIRSLGIELDDFTRAGAHLASEVEAPADTGAGDEELVVDEGLAEAGAAAPAEGVHGFAVAEVGVFGEGFLVGWPGGGEPAFGAVGFGVGVLGGDAVDVPGAGLNISVRQE